MIPKIIHISWKTKDILQNPSPFVQNCIASVVKLSPGWTPILYDDADLESYLKEYLDKRDYDLLKNKHIVEKCDVWRLIKMYNEGGLYVDIDRLCNMSLNDIIPPTVKVVLPTWQDYDFSQDFMCSAPKNPMFLEALSLNLERRFCGYDNIYLLGPQTYFHGVTKSLTGRIIEVRPGIELMDQLRQTIQSSGFMHTFRENSIYDSFLFRLQDNQWIFDHEAEKKKFYKNSTVSHWTGEF